MNEPLDESKERSSFESIYYDLPGISVVRATMAESLLASPTVGNMMESDIPGALLSEPVASHTMPELR